MLTTRALTPEATENHNCLTSYGGKDDMNAKIIIKNQLVKMTAPVLAALAIATLASTPAIAQNAVNDNAVGLGKFIEFQLVRSNGLINFPNVTPRAHGNVTVRSMGTFEIMRVTIAGLPADTVFNLFITQVPNAPFALSWFEGEIKTNQFGEGSAEFIGRFSKETFIVAPGVAAAPVDPFMGVAGSIPDASQNPVTGSVQIYHLGVWFNSPADVVKLGGPGTVTAFNGQHNAGVQVLSTAEFPDGAGPLFFLNNFQ
jgi:hypothetical protein